MYVQYCRVVIFWKPRQKSWVMERVIMWTLASLFQQKNHIGRGLLQGCSKWQTCELGGCSLKKVERKTKHLSLHCWVLIILGGWLGREPQNWIKTRQRVSPGAVECWLAFHNLPIWLGLVASKYSCHYRKMGKARIRTWMHLCSLCPIRMSAKKTLGDFLHIQMTSPSLFPVALPKCWLQMAGSEIL